MTPTQAIKAAIRFDEYAARFLVIRNNKTHCPVHEEKTPSFIIHEQYGKCFGCGWSCDVISFAARYHDISTGAAIRMLAKEAGIQLTGQPKKHPYEAIKAARVRTEATEWRRQTRESMVSAEDYETSFPFIEDLDSMNTQQVIDFYRSERTAEGAAMLRAAAARRATPTVTSLLLEFLKWSR